MQFVRIHKTQKNQYYCFADSNSRKLFFPDKTWTDCTAGYAFVEIKKEFDRFGFVVGHMVTEASDIPYQNIDIDELFSYIATHSDRFIGGSDLDFRQKIFEVSFGGISVKACHDNMYYIMRYHHESPNIEHMLCIAESNGEFRTGPSIISLFELTPDDFPHVSIKLIGTASQYFAQKMNPVANSMRELLVPFDYAKTSVFSYVDRLRHWVDVSDKELPFYHDMSQDELDIIYDALDDEFLYIYDFGDNLFFVNVRDWPGIINYTEAELDTLKSFIERVNQTFVQTAIKLYGVTAIKT